MEGIALAGVFDDVLVIIAGVVTGLVLVVGVIVIVLIQQRRMFAVQQKNMEVLAESEERYRRLVNFSPFPMVVLIGGVIRYVNDAGAKLFGTMNPEELIGKPLEEYGRSSFYEQAKSRIHRFLENPEELTSIEEKFVRHDGRVMDIEVTAIPITFEGQNAVQVVIRDITERKRQEQELIAAKERAEQSDRLKDAFIANISHEIRTPLNVILGYSSLIMSEMADRIKEEELTFFESIERGGQRLMRTVEHILNISSIQAGTFELHPEPIDVNDRVETLILDMRSIAAEKGLTLETVNDYPGALIIADRYCFDQALINLIDNAIKFTNRGGVTIRTYRQDRRVCIEVSDTGIGISAEYLPKVFNIFSQEIIGYTRPFEGLGLGLALTKRYVEFNQGSITVKSRKGMGTTFTVRFLTASALDGIQEELPLHVESPHPMAIEPLPPERKNAKSILLVEDDVETQEYMNALLKRDYNLQVANSGREAWDILNATTIDLILMDLSLRGDEDGLHLTQRIRQDKTFHTIPIIAITAHAFPEDKQRCLAVGCNRYLSKPFKIEELKQTLAEFLYRGEPS
ncbi:MAG: response regulator [Bacteroidota bacterium]|nr:response regulator [Bacteroidota bacterium]